LIVSILERKGNTLQEAPVETAPNRPDGLDNLLAVEQQLEREWWWLQGALNATAELSTARAGTDPGHLRGLQAQAREVDRRRVQIAVRLAELNLAASGTGGATPL
jgi:hypothetical protein